MRFEQPLRRGRLIQRYKRFLADIELDDGTAITATCPNTGSMMGLCSPGSAVWVSESDRKSRKYRHTWELVETDLGKGPVLAGINTSHPNRLVAEAITEGRVPGLSPSSTLRREVKYGVNSRIDILLEDATGARTYVEIKNVHLSRKQGLAEFPDSVTERGVKHLAELTRMVSEGHRAVMLFLIQRGDARRFTVAADIDPAYAAALAAASAAGVETLAYNCLVSPEEIRLHQAVVVRP